MVESQVHLNLRKKVAKFAQFFAQKSTNGTYLSNGMVTGKVEEGPLRQHHIKSNIT